MSKIPGQSLITNYRKFKVKFVNGGIRKYEYSRANKGIFFYNVFDENEKLFLIDIIFCELIKSVDFGIGVLIG